MAALTYLDTHVAAWLFAGEIDRLPEQARAAIEAGDLALSPMAVLELQYLFEIGRTTHGAQVVVDALRDDVGLRVCEVSWARVAAIACKQSWTRNPFDRLIVSHAMLQDAPLVTKDTSMLEHYRRAVWSRDRS